MFITTQERYCEATDENQGFCTNCRAFIDDFVEPDASGYVCSECNQLTVYGAEQALLLGLISF